MALLRRPFTGLDQAASLHRRSGRPHGPGLASGGANHTMDELQLVEHRVGQNERIAVALAETAVHAVQKTRQRQPVAQQLFAKWLRRAGRRFTPRGQALAARKLRLPVARGFQAIDQMQVVRPGLGPVLPRVATCVGADSGKPLVSECKRRDECGYGAW